MRILIFGDSITQGFWDVTGGGWAQRITADYNAQTIKNLSGDYPETFGLGISGDTTQGVLKRLPYEVEARRWPDTPFVFVFAIGINDTQFDGKAKASTPERFAEELDTLYGAAGHYSKKIMFVGLTPVDDK